MSEAPLIETRGVTKVYDHGPGAAAVEDFSIEFHAGDFAAIAGPSGSGKSTLLNIIGTLDKPTAGEVLYEGGGVSGLAVEELSDFRLRSLGFVFQAYNLIPVLTAVENAEYPLVLQGAARAERRRRALEVLGWVGIEDLAHRRPDRLSGGQQQRVAVARAIVHGPKVVLADEPTANLDSKTAASLLDLMESLNRERGVTFIFSSHDPAVLGRARRVVQIRDGRLAGDSSK
ncbi:MAG: ABC transporter ATP-binding protein [Elusimicrobia bacterium]|nr:ABC transporter ATP-binding protein [Elusimicrobiota bacterium]